MPSINRITLAGHLGRDPESKTFSNGGSVCNFSMATTEKWKDKDGQPKERTDWHQIVANGKTGEVAQKYLRKGAAVLIEGSVRYREYEKDGQKRYVTEVMADRLHFLTSGEKSPQKPAQEDVQAPVSAGGSSIDQDIPFMPRSWKEG